jgi:hypothetical protein
MHTPNPGNGATKTGERAGPCTELGCTKGACRDGIVLQHSWLCSWPCDEQCIVSQHCIACSGVVMAPQSIAYPAIAATRAKRKICFTRCISTKLDALSD